MLSPTNAELMRDDYEHPTISYPLVDTEEETREAEVKFYWNDEDEITIVSILNEAGEDIENLLEPDVIYEIIQKCMNYYYSPTIKKTA